MPRIDVWDVPVEPPQTQQEPLWVGFTRGKLEDRFDIGKQLGQGGFGSVRVVVERGSGKEYACKSITKRLDVPNVSASKQNQQLENIRREALILRRLRGTLNVVHLEDMFEDEEAVHLVMEWCKGGELLQRINTRHYSERTAASYIRAVLRTLAQCHHLRILHRDIKPGNFMLLTDADKAPVKAIDFGLAVFFDPKKLPRKDLGLEGTPHFMAPEQLSGKTEPASDIWSAGVMAYQLLCGFVPFDDHKNPRAPALSLVWRAILTEEPKFSHRAWEGVSEEAKDFVRSLLAKDPAKRPTAKQALGHPWLQGKSDQRTQGAPLARTVVQRLQKFGVENALKRTVLDMIANDLINRHMEQLNRMQLDGAGATGAAPPQTGAAAAAADPPPQPEPQAHAQAQGQQPAAERRFSRTSSTGRRSIEAAEATPEGAAAAAVARSALPPAAAAADGGGGGAAAVTSRLRQLAAQDLLLRAAAPAGAIKHATVHAGGDALAALRRGQLLGLTLPLAVPPPAGGGGAGLPAGSLAAAIAALKQQQQPHVHRRRSHDLGKRPLGRAVTSINPEEPTQSEAQARPPLPAWHAQSQDQQQQPAPGEQGQQQQGQDDGRTAEPLAPPPAAAGAAAALPPQLSLPSRLPATAPPTRPFPWRPFPLPGGASSPAGASGAAAAAAAAAGASAASTSSGYRGPVKDLAAATAWDMSFMKNRLALEGSGHALQHYAWLLNVGERSLHGVLERSFHAGAGGRAHHPHSGEPTATGPGPQSPAAGLQRVHSLTAVTAGSPAAAAVAGAGSALPRRSHLGMGAGQIGAQPASPAGASPRAVGGGSGSGAAGETVAGSSPDYLRMLSLVARQRAEHRKYQRLSLDTSGHRQTHYEELMAAEAEAGAAAGGDPRVGSFQEMAPPQEADEEDEAAAGASGTATASADTTGAFSLPPPSGATSAFATTATSLTPPTEAQLDAAAAASPSAQRLPQTPLQQALPRQSRSGATASVPPSPAPSGTRQLSRLSAQMFVKPSIPGLAEADALGVGNAGVGGEPAAPLSGLRGGSEGGMSYESSSPADGGGGGEESLAGLEEDSGAAGAARLSAAGAAGGEGGKRSSLLRKVRKALMNPVKNLLGSSKHSGSSAGKATGGGAGGAGGARQSGTGTGATTPLPGAATPGHVPLAKLSAALAPSLAAVSVGSVSAAGAATDAADERGRGRGAYAAFLQFGGGGGGGGGGGTGTATPQDVSAHGGTERSVHGGRERSVHGGTNDRSAHSDRSGHFGREGRTGSATQLPGPAGYAIHTVKAHKTPPAAAPQAAAAAAAAPSEAAQAPAAAGDGSGGQEQDQQQQQQQQPAERGAGSGAEGGSADAAAAAARVEGEGAGGGGGGDKGGITQGDLAPALDLLLGDPAKTAELQEVMRRLQYDKAEELTYEQLSEGLQWLGYRLEPSEVQDLLRQVAVGANEGLTASQFIASQVDWRTFQANHRAEWLDCLRKAFEELGGGPGPGGRVSMDQLMAALNEKLPEEEVNLAVQESLMDAAVEADEVDFDAFVRLMRCNSNDSLASGASSEMSYDLYDPRLKDSSLHGPLGDGVHYHPALETVPDDPE